MPKALCMPKPASPQDPNGLHVYACVHGKCAMLQSVGSLPRLQLS